MAREARRLIPSSVRGRSAHSSWPATRKPRASACRARWHSFDRPHRPWQTITSVSHECTPLPLPTQCACGTRRSKLLVVRGRSAHHHGRRQKDPAHRCGARRHIPCRPRSLGIWPATKIPLTMNSMRLTMISSKSYLFRRAYLPPNVLRDVLLEI